jgi:hypothetical protein
MPQSLPSWGPARSGENLSHLPGEYLAEKCNGGVQVVGAGCAGANNSFGNGVFEDPAK